MEKLIEIAKKAGQMILNAHCQSSDIEVKPGDANFVTKHDKAVQEFLKKELFAVYSNALFIGEESGEDGYKKADTLIVVDPIDGTTNFIKNTRHSCVSIGILKNGVPYKSVVYNPYDNEVFYAKRGGGAYLNNKAIHVSNAHLKDALVGFGTTPYDKELFYKTINLLKELVPCCADIRRQGSAALDLCFIACGRFDLFFEYRLSLWDYCAAGLIVSEAGGIIKGRGDCELEFNGPSAIIAGNPTAYREFLEKFDF